ncbi:invasion protein IalB [Pseudomonas sp. BIGb0408]|uniref:Invasion protein IalB n=1 Tax=Phytopseudomonas flavescens TaxID=29435 RepID=A0A7Z0BN44_9GAMM|nr:invasion protein IalB [Pseudomonas sp. BIGb0408]NYH73192.1 invasion protein IalB [Pseudomonas flavescens]
MVALPLNPYCPGDSPASGLLRYWRCLQDGCSTPRRCCLRPNEYLQILACRSPLAGDTIVALPLNLRLPDDSPASGLLRYWRCLQDGCSRPRRYCLRSCKYLQIQACRSPLAVALPLNLRLPDDSPASGLLRYWRCLQNGCSTPRRYCLRPNEYLQIQACRSPLAGDTIVALPLNLRLPDDSPASRLLRYWRCLQNGCSTPRRYCLRPNEYLQIQACRSPLAGDTIVALPLNLRLPDDSPASRLLRYWRCLQDVCSRPRLRCCRGPANICRSRPVGARLRAIRLWPCC